MADDIGSIKSINGTSLSLNNQSGQGGQKPSVSAGNSNPGDTKPKRPEQGPVPIP